ncbi:2-oxoglutarate dehydrogenase complex dihydrolipoyllysine-residue succinyltransferase [Candidatus Profftella armatura (Diaphorina cf. continua)]|uniref:Dihydrolipoyllysine-residue succinyltransferase component of 2-oxoglutarate dehydrogenase complex n=1 Tax=Candidatus Profftella armatura (Diaphorina cf. continua) TaxID=2661583 RepID=A0A7R7ABN9_9PROT|nr:2-oxoglutarate dehydrogenase complex dihydrolipoyllysine-residue succinyltransferase [Candidatus Profftella armatura (Diaphorina cf. continua)]BCG49501.1 2-oxoglutarate dehydrogenase complex dihydrolipoyllysine-residue succinyltransferase [Candidatus Profftella armatura (Diaphorina cf. continua)]
MALIEVKVPQLSESISEATLLNWHKKEGELVVRNENLIDIETDKVILELPAPQDGIINKIIISDGSIVTSNQVIALIDTNVSKLNSKTEIKNKKDIKNLNTIAMPSAKKILSDNNLKISQINGTGKDGRIIKEDVLKVLSSIKNINKKIPEKSKPYLNNISIKNNSRLEEYVPMSRLRMCIAERLLQSQANSAILTTFNEVNMQSIIDLRLKYKDKFEKEHNVKLGFMSFFVKAVVSALKQYPIINASVDSSNIIYHKYYDIGIAISSSRGLVVPILRNADIMSISDIEKKINEFSNKAHNNKLLPEEMSGGTFTISNGGVFGSMLSTPIINPPQSAILGVHAIKKRVIVENNNIVIRPINYFALSYDHRIIDGREAVLSLAVIKKNLEDPYCLFLDL